MEISYTQQQKIIAFLYGIGDDDLAARLDRCMTARQQRHYGDGWPFSCRSSACFWCRRAMIRGWWEGMRYWSEAATTASLAIISIRSPAGIPDAVRRLRRGLRDVRDRTARRFRRWRTVSFAGLIGGDHRALVLVSHEGVARRELQDVLCRRWPSVVLKDLEHLISYYFLLHLRIRPRGRFTSRLLRAAIPTHGLPPQTRRNGSQCTYCAPPANIRFMFHAMVTRLHSPRTCRGHAHELAEPDHRLDDPEHRLGRLLRRACASALLVWSYGASLQSALDFPVRLGPLRTFSQRGMMHLPPSRSPAQSRRRRRRHVPSLK